MPISTDQALAGIEKFVEDYPGAENLQFYVVNKFEDLYGREKAQHIPEKAKGAYHPARGFVALACANIHNDGDLRETLRHEVIGHYGTLTFERGQKKTLMTAIRGSRQSPDMADDWAYIDRVYSNAPESIKVFPVYAGIYRTFPLRPVFSHRVPRICGDIPVTGVVRQVFRVTNCYYSPYSSLGSRNGTGSRTKGHDHD